MRKLFLSSIFKEVEQLFIQFVNENLGSIENIKGKKMEIISTAALVEKGAETLIKEAEKIYMKMGLDVGILELTEDTEKT